MRKLIIIAILVAAFAGFARADSYTWTSGTLSTDTAVEVSSALPVRGYLDRMIVRNSNASAITNQVILATYIGGVEGDVLCVSTAVTTTVDVQIPRRLGTATGSGVEIAAVSAGGSTNLSYYTTQMLGASYEKIYLSGDTRLKVTVDAPAAVTNVTTVTLIYEPEK